VKILFIANWWPNDEVYSGIFIKEHAKSIALYHEVHVLNVKFEPTRTFYKSVFSKKNYNEDGMQICEVKIKIPKGRLFNNRYTEVFKRIIIVWLYKYYASILVAKTKYPLIHLNVFSSDFEFLFTDKKYKDIPKVLTEHSGYYLPAQNRLQGEELNKFILYTQKWLNQPMLKAILPVSKHLEQTLINYYNIKTPQFVVPNIVTVSDELPASTETEKIKICLVANWEYPKDLNLFLQAIDRLSQEELNGIKITMGGFGSLYDEAIQHKFNKEIDISYRGRLNKMEVYQLLKQSDLLVHPTLSETFSCIVAEALSYGTPVLSMKTGIMLDIINEDNGIAVNIGDDQLFYDSLVNILDKLRNKKFDRNKISATYQTKFSPKTVGSLISDIYSSVLQSKLENT
jgi:glycosyltransferase involved in cell wall biosynthesis